MDRKEALRLGSRVLSIVFGVSALVETTYLPERLLSYLHYTNELASAGVRSGSTYLPTLYRLEVGLLFLRITIYLILAVIFWNCAPLVERTLLPEEAP